MKYITKKGEVIITRPGRKGLNDEILFVTLPHENGSGCATSIELILALFFLKSEIDERNYPQAEGKEGSNQLYRAMKAVKHLGRIEDIKSLLCWFKIDGYEEYAHPERIKRLIGSHAWPAKANKVEKKEPTGLLDWDDASMRGM